MVKPLIAFQKCLKYKSETVHWGRCCKAHVSLFQINLLLKQRSITQEPKPFREDCFILLFRTIYHLFFPTFTAGWRPESNKASFLMMFPTPGMTAWSMRTSHNIRRLWLLTASSEWEKLKCWEHTSRASKALTFCTQSSVNLQIYMRHKVNCCILEIMQVWTVSFMWSRRCFLWDGTAKKKKKFQAAEINVRLAAEQYTTILKSMNRTNVRPKRRCFSCDNNRWLQAQPNVGHTEWDTHTKVILDHLNLSNRHPCPLYLASTVLSKKHTMSLVRCISSTSMELFLSFLSAGFMLIDPFIPKWTLKRKD